MLNETVLKHLNQFSDERRQGRSGQQEWDNFLVYAYRDAAPTDDEVESWLKENLKSGQETLMEDFRRVGTLFRLREEVALEQRDRLREPKEPAYFLSAELDVRPRPGGAPVGVHIRDDEEGKRSLFCSLSPEMRKRNPHMLIVGNEGAGKSQLLQSMILHDIECGDRAVVVVDTTGRLVDELLNTCGKKFGEEATARIVVCDSSSDECPRFNPLALTGNQQRLANAYVRSFKAVNGAGWNQHSENILRNSLTLLMVNGRSLADLEQLLTDEHTRDSLIGKVEDREDAEDFATLLVSWDNYRRLARTQPWNSRIEPVLKSLKSFQQETVQKALTGDSDFSLSEIITKKKILLIRADNGKAFFGSLLVSSIACVAEALRLSAPAGTNFPVALYVDELSGVMEREMVAGLVEALPPVDVGFVGVTGSLAIEDGEGAAGTTSSIQDLLPSFGCTAAFAVNEKDAAPLARVLLRAELEGSQEERNNIQRLMSQKKGHFFWRPSNRASSALPMTIAAVPVAGNRGS